MIFHLLVAMIHINRVFHEQAQHFSHAGDAENAEFESLEFVEHQ